MAVLKHERTARIEIARCRLARRVVEAAEAGAAVRADLLLPSAVAPPPATAGPAAGLAVLVDRHFPADLVDPIHLEVVHHILRRQIDLLGLRHQVDPKARSEREDIQATPGHDQSKVTVVALAELRPKKDQRRDLVVPLPRRVARPVQPAMIDENGRTRSV